MLGFFRTMAVASESPVFDIADRSGSRSIDFWKYFGNKAPPGLLPLTLRKLNEARQKKRTLSVSPSTPTNDENDDSGDESEKKKKKKTPTDTVQQQLVEEEEEVADKVDADASDAREQMLATQYLQEEDEEKNKSNL